MNKRKDLQNWLKKADKAFSKFIRFRDKDFFCPLCGITPVQCCFHFVRRHRKSVRWDEKNAVGACHKCNFTEKFNPDLSRAWYIGLFGSIEYLKLVEKSRVNFIPSISYLKAIVKKYAPKTE